MWNLIFLEGFGRTWPRCEFQDPPLVNIYLFTYYMHLLSMCMYACVNVCEYMRYQDACVEIRGRLSDVSSLLLLHGTWRSNSGHRLSSRYLDLLSHLSRSMSQLVPPTSFRVACGLGILSIATTITRKGRVDSHRGCTQKDGLGFVCLFMLLRPSLNSGFLCLSLLSGKIRGMHYSVWLL